MSADNRRSKRNVKPGLKTENDKIKAEIVRELKNHSKNTP